MSVRITLTTFAVAGSAASFATAAKSIEANDGEMLPIRLDAWAAGAVAVRVSVPPGTVTVPHALLVTRDQQEASDDKVTTLRSDARYLRGLAEDAPTGEDAAALRKIAAKIEALAAAVLPEE